MPRISFDDGVLTHECEDWIDFNDFITERLERSPVVWRGQRDAEWLLEPTLTRVVRRTEKRLAGNSHLEKFRYATRGRRGASPRQIADGNDEEWWALGQHHGLATPLLDWTHSPYVAAFFAYAEETAPPKKFRVVYGLVEGGVVSKSKEIQADWSAAKSQYESRGDHGAVATLGRPEVVTFIRPLTDENQRLINQNGLFTRSPLSIGIEQWVRKHFPGQAKFPKLYKLLLPEAERLTALRSLNRMNINYLTLYPDMVGASLHCNMCLEIDHY
jgi:hypothetical protein